jgi:hypothetical protein
VSAFTTGTELTAAMASIRSWPNVRQTMAAHCRSSTRAVSAMGSPRPNWVDPESQDERVAAEFGDADAERDPGAGRGLVEEHGDRPWTVQRAVREAIPLQLRCQLPAPRPARTGTGRRRGGSA